MIEKAKNNKKEDNKSLKQKVFVALSGGVDSSVAAALLKEKGFLVAGVHMRFWHQSNKNKKSKIAEAENRARKVAGILKIPFFVFNFEKEFKKKVINYFLKESQKGLTPNPCVFCNKEIKLGLFLKKSLQLKADFIATGHYVRKIGSKNFKLTKGKDKNKDQSYFLWRLNQKQLKKVLFPVGDYTKNQVKEMAKKFNLSLVIRAPESQEICFIKTTTNDFLRKYLKQKKGNIIDNKGNILGQHQGLWFYTIGQRKGIGFPGGPYYVLNKDFKNNILVITKNEKDLYNKELIIEKIGWILDSNLDFPFKVKAKIRYRHKPALATLYKIENNKYKVLFGKPQRAITPGQSVVFYKGQELLGGGIIK